MNLNRKILVSGASAGIGRAICEKLLLQNDWRVVGIARDFAKWSERPAGLSTLEIDLAELDYLAAKIKSELALLSDIDGIILCAGRGRFGSLEEFSTGQIRQLIDINITSQILLVRQLLPLLKQKGRGDIIILGSEAALSGGKRGAVYSATKFAIRGFAQALRHECASSGVRVTIINPGMVKTDFFAELDFEPGENPANYITPEDIADTVFSVLDMRQQTVVDEINLSPLIKVIKSKPRY